MAKTIPKEKDGNAQKTQAAFAKKEKKQAKASKNNPSKYAPTGEAELDIATHNPEDGLKKLFTDSIKDLYWAENHLVKALPKMAKAAGSKELSKAILDHLKQTVVHAERLEQVFNILGKKVKAKKCDAMEGLSKEGEGVVENTDSGTAARDLGIIMASQKVEHYEIASYKGLIGLASGLGLKEVVNILTQTLAEEQESDELLGKIAAGILPAGRNKNDQ